MANEETAETKVKRKYEELYAKIDKTARSRFIAARRCQCHEIVSLYTVAVISCCIIGLTLFDALEMLTPDADKWSAFLQVFCAVGVLVYSVILSKYDFSLRAHLYHQCGLELNRLKQRVFKLMVDPPKSDEYEKTAKIYAGILERFENHSLNDFHLMQIETSQYSNEYGVNLWFRFRVWGWHLLGYWHYALFGILSVGAIVAIYVNYGAP